ncbi:hypothetical protein GCM10025862_08990 [Arsenicicoccus piscis]|uniref:Uncharacterized protein n=1 Tax=Arsenicicoccus piscis TaxID=673954 RepID=A0ABQ6HMH6_9MICO|nr:hypothetical protein GCM10025862_08990 [Arsenicicoccus piscis]
MRLVGRLVRREPDVAVGPEDVGRPELRLERRDQRLHRLTDERLVVTLVRLPPVTAVVLLQLGVEVERRARDAREVRHAPQARTSIGGVKRFQPCGSRAAAPML